MENKKLSVGERIERLKAMADESDRKTEKAYDELNSIRDSSINSVLNYTPLNIEGFVSGIDDMTNKSQLSADTISKMSFDLKRYSALAKKVYEAIDSNNLNRCNYVEFEIDSFKNGYIQNSERREAYKSLVGVLEDALKNKISKLPRGLFF